jgi:hypothetical protein
VGGAVFSSHVTAASGSTSRFFFLPALFIQHYSSILNLFRAVPKIPIQK